MGEPALGTDVICQIGMVVRDIDKTAAAFQEVLGLPAPRVQETAPASETNIRYRGKATEARAKLAFFQMGPQLNVELIEPIGGPSTWQEFLDEHGEGVHHIAFRLKGMDAKLAHLEAHGLETVQRGDFKGGRYAYVDATDKLKVILELLENL
jgi:catechol 2,3-dioxygenase-like lactoylglutathione lyase family enzyme